MSIDLVNNVKLEPCAIVEAQYVNKLLREHNEELSNKVEFFISKNATVHIVLTELTLSEEEQLSCEKSAQEIFLLFRDKGLLNSEHWCE